MSEYIYPVTILSQDTLRPFRELKNKDYKNFVKIISYDDPQIFNRFVDSLIVQLSVDDINIGNLTCLDKLYILMCVRANCISTEVTLVTRLDEEEVEGEIEEEIENVDGKKDSKEDAEVKIPIHINEILQKLGEYEIEHTYEIKDKTITILGTLPKKLYYDDIYDVVADTISEIRFDDRSISVTGLDLPGKQQVLSRLPSFALPSIFKFIETQQNILDKVPLMEFKSKKKLPIGDSFKLHLFNGTVHQLIRIIFNTSLKDFYNTEYMLMRRFKFSYEAITNCTPAEMSVYYSIIQSDVEREKRDMEAQQAQQKTMGGR